MPKRERRKRKKASKSEAAAAVELGLVKRSRAEAVAHKRSEDLFVLDGGPGGGGVAHKSARDRKQDLVLQRKLKAADKESRREENEKRAKRELTRQRAKAASSGVDLATQLTTAAQARQARQAQQAARDAGLFDLWGADSAITDAATRKTQKVLAEPQGDKTDNWVDGVLRRKGMHKMWRRAREADPKDHRNNKFGLRAATVVAPGGSYNPDETQRRALVREQIDAEVAKRAVHLGQDKATVAARLALKGDADTDGDDDDSDSDSDGAAEAGPRALGDAKSAATDGEADAEKEDEDEEEGDDWLVHNPEHHRAKDKLTRTQRNKQRRHREIMGKHAAAKAAKQLAHELRRPKALAKKLRSEEEEAKAKRADEEARRRAFYSDPRNAKVKIGGKIRPVVDSVSVLLADEAEQTPSVRTLPGKTCAVRDRMNNMLRRNQVEMGNRRRRRRKGVKSKYDTRDNGGVNLLIAERQRQREQGLIK